MLVFIIPLRSPGSTQHWRRCELLCRNTIRSALSQTDPNVRVILSCKEFDPGDIQDSRLTVLRGDYPEVGSDWRSGATDKTYKVVAGRHESKQYTPCYTMLIDADDLVSNKLAEYVHRVKHPVGYYLPLGYTWMSGASTVTINDQFHRVCGSSGVVYTEPANLEESGDSSVTSLLRFPHHEIVEHFSRQGKSLHPVPFPAAIYRRATGSNLSETGGVVVPSMSWPVWKKCLKAAWQLRRRRFVTAAMKQEFSMENEA